MTDWVAVKLNDALQEARVNERSEEVLEAIQEAIDVVDEG